MTHSNTQQVWPASTHAVSRVKACEGEDPTRAKARDEVIEIPREVDAATVGCARDGDAGASETRRGAQEPSGEFFNVSTNADRMDGECLHVAWGAFVDVLYRSDEYVILKKQSLQVLTSTPVVWFPPVYSSAEMILSTSTVEGMGCGTAAA
jgi:hypothetical protein